MRDACHGFSENTFNAREQIRMRCVAVKGHGEMQPMRALLFDSKEGLCVCEGVGTNLEREIIAAKFALVADAPADPPDGGMEE